jgi:hypothetical protein
VAALLARLLEEHRIIAGSSPPHLSRSSVATIDLDSWIDALVGRAHAEIGGRCHYVCVSV